MPPHPLFSIVNERGNSQPRQSIDLLNAEPSTTFIIFSSFAICICKDLQALMDILRSRKEGRNRQWNKVNVRIKMSSYHIVFPRPESSQNLRKKIAWRSTPRHPARL